jgi:hypothetical protein
MNNKYLNIDWLKNNHEMVHFFGLGFIQLKINKMERLHFYTDLLPKTANDEEIHNHRYNFVSRILGGLLYQEIFEISTIKVLNSEFYVTQETCSAEHKEFPKVDCDVNKVFAQFYDEGTSYYIDHNTFHKVKSANAITHVMRSDYKKELSDVVFKKTQEKVCPFSIKKTSDELFQIIEQIIKNK